MGTVGRVRVNYYNTYEFVLLTLWHYVKINIYHKINYESQIYWCTYVLHQLLGFYDKQKYLKIQDNE